MTSMSRRARLLAALRANLACRGRLGLGRVVGTPAELERLAAALLPRPPRESLESIRRRMGQCERCPLAADRRHIVFGQGPEPAAIMLIGEAPGAEEDRQGLPFVGPAGKLLNRMLAAVGLRREEVYITNIVKCRPPGNRDPRPEEAAACRPFLEAQIRAVAPRVICTLGRPAAQALLGTKAPISTLRGRWHRVLGVPLLPTFHPAFLLRSPERKREAYQDLKAVARALEGKERLD